MASEYQPPRVAVAAIVRNQAGQILTGIRKGSSNGSGIVADNPCRPDSTVLTGLSGTWQLTGGHLEYGEAFFACAERETLEETGLKVHATKLVAVTNTVFEDKGLHYITLFVLCEMEDPSAKPQVQC